MCGRSLDWGHVYSVSVRTGVVPLVYRQLKMAGGEMAPAEIMKKLEHDFHENARKGLFLAGEMVRLYEMLESRGIKAVAFKGPLSAVSLYGNLALRPFNDLDIMVCREELQSVAGLLYGRGYRPQDGMEHFVKSVPDLPARMLTEEIMFRRESDGSTVDLHIAPIQGRYLKHGKSHGIGEKKVHVSLGGRKLKTFEPVDLLIYLCVHGSKHMWDKLLMVSDVARLTVAWKDNDWEKANKRAALWGARRRLFLGLFLSGELLGANIPNGIAGEIENDPEVFPLARRFEKGLFRPDKDKEMSFKELSTNLRLLDDNRSRARYCSHLIIVPQPKDFSLFRVPPALFFLYFVLRPLRLFIKHIPWRLAGWLAHHGKKTDNRYFRLTV